MKNQWPSNLPAAKGDALVVAGLEGCLDILTPESAVQWLETDLKSCILSFQDEYEMQAALIFWLPCGKRRINTASATDTYSWCCSPPATDRLLPIGQALWAGAQSDVKQIFKADDPNRDGEAWIGLYHPRIS